MIASINSTDLVSWPAPLEGGALQSKHSPTGVESDTGSDGDSGVVITLSDEAIKALEEADSDTEEKSEDKSSSGQTSATGKELTDKEKQIVAELKARDAEVRAHEQAHVAAAGGLASAPTYEYQTGPDDKRYAVGGHVHIDTSPGGTPEETLMKAEKIRAAALAPGQPSPQDRAVAGQAAQMAGEARMQMAQEKQEEIQETLESGTDDSEVSAVPSLEDAANGIEQYEHNQKDSEEPTIDSTYSMYV